MATLGREPLSNLARRCRLAGALQPQHEYHAGSLIGRLEAALGVAEKRHHLVANNLDDLLRRHEAAQHAVVDRVHGAIPHPVDKRFDDLEVDVGL